ncbi:MAG TPA: lysophospholipid acyltransferase family protein [Ktedonosporobacter sp.]|jgi:1-acyl-sn-glycerol-3-phosphate acyltransferase|nr:lysophospholipid acyltransferase family protein [Ktedonosporobacter sp.]
MTQDVTTQAEIGKPEKPGKPGKPEKNLYVPYSTPRVVYEMLRWVVLFIFAIIVRVSVRGRYNIPRKGPYIIAANHLSWTDIPLIAAYIPGKVIYMAKEETFHNKVSWVVRFLGAFPVKRGEADRQSMRAADEQLKNGRVLVIFPEGTRSKTRTLARGHAGLGMIALRSGVPVIPVAIWGSENALKKFGARVTIVYGEPIELKPQGVKITREEINNATEQVMQSIAALLPAQYRGVYGNAQQ